MCFVHQRRCDQCNVGDTGGGPAPAGAPVLMVGAPGVAVGDALVVSAEDNNGCIKKKKKKREGAPVGDAVLVEGFDAVLVEGDVVLEARGGDMQLW